jgi:hypothetical protein
MNSSFLLNFLACVLMLLIMLVAVNDASLLSKLMPKREKCMMYNPSVHGHGSHEGSHEGHRVKRVGRLISTKSCGVSVDKIFA